MNHKIGIDHRESLRVQKEEVNRESEKPRQQVLTLAGEKILSEIRDRADEPKQGETIKWRVPMSTIIENMSSIKRVLMKRDGMLPNDADNLIQEAREQLEQYLFNGDMDSAHNICEEFFGLEPDYIFELI